MRESVWSEKSVLVHYLISVRLGLITRKGKRGRDSGRS